MELHEGAYENLITNELKNDIAQADGQGLVCQKGDIDGAEQPTMLAHHIGNLILGRLNDEALTLEEKIDFANSLIDFLGNGDEERIADSRQMLTAVLSKQTEAHIKATGRLPLRPPHGFSHQ